MTQPDPRQLGGGYFPLGKWSSLNHGEPEPPREEDPQKTPARKQGLVKRAAAWAKAEASLQLEGPVLPQVFEARAASCKACPAREEHKDDPIGYCSECGCGHNPRARLTVKLTMPAATCPRETWKPSKGGKKTTKKPAK